MLVQQMEQRCESTGYSLGRTTGLMRPPKPGTNRTASPLGLVEGSTCGCIVPRKQPQATLDGIEARRPRRFGLENGELNQRSMPLERRPA